MKKKGLLALCLSSLLVISACGNGDNVAETDSGAITQEEFYQALKDSRGESVLQTLVYDKILSKKFDVTAEVDEKMKEYEDNYGDQLELLVQQQLGLPNVEAFKEQIRLDLLIQAYAISKTEVTDEEIQAAYDAFKPEIRASHILIGSDVENAEEKAKDLKKQIDEGADFATLAKENSTDSGSAANGGDLDFFGTGVMDSAFEEAAYSLEVGEVSDVVQSQFGFHIIKLTDKKEKDSFDNMKEELRKQVAGNKLTNELAAQYLQELAEENNVKVLDKDLENLFKPAVTENTTDDDTNTTTEDGTDNDTNTTTEDGTDTEK